MIEKLKELGLAAKGLFLYILAPLGTLIAYIVYLQYKVRDLKDSLSESKANQELAEVLIKKEEIHEKATKAELDYSAIRTAYFKQYGGTEPKPPTKH